MRKYGLIGYPLGHSFSKSYFTKKFREENISGCSYDNYPLSEIDLLPELIAREPDLCGLNVTIPYKSDVLEFLDYIDDEAGEIGAVNVVKIRRGEGEVYLSGFNSDVTGIRDSLAGCLGSVSTAVILGTGGSSRAVRYVLEKAGLMIIQVSRTKRPGFIDYSELNAGLLAKAGLIVNTTPVGMYPHAGARPEIDYSCLGPGHVLFDLVYNPEVTFFLNSGLERGCRIVTGLGMLHSQAERAWEIWNDASC